MKDFVGVQEGQRPRHVKRNAVAGVVPHGASVLAVYGVRKVASVHQLQAAPPQEVDECGCLPQPTNRKRVPLA